MALPIRPNSGAQPAARPASVNKPSPKPIDSQEFSLPSLDDFSEPSPPRKIPSKKPINSSSASKQANNPPVKKPSIPEEEPEKQTEEDLEEGWAIDPKTGVKYKKIPKSVFEGKGKNAIPVLAIEDFDVDDMVGEAETYLGHLRVAPNKEEQEQLKKLRAQMRRKSDASYAEANKDELEKEDEPEIDPVPKSKASSKVKESKPSFMQKLAGLFR